MRAPKLEGRRIFGGRPGKIKIKLVLNDDNYGTRYLSLQAILQETWYGVERSQLCTQYKHRHYHPWQVVFHMKSGKFHEIWQISVFKWHRPPCPLWKWSFLSWVIWFIAFRDEIHQISCGFHLRSGGFHVDFTPKSTLCKKINFWALTTYRSFIWKTKNQVIWSWKESIWYTIQKSGHMLFTGVSWVNNDKIRLNGCERSNLGTQWKIRSYGLERSHLDTQW